MTMDLPPVSEQIMQTLSELARSFQDMADRCLLVLHLEVRYDAGKPKTAAEVRRASPIAWSFWSISLSLLVLTTDVLFNFFTLNVISSVNHCKSFKHMLYRKYGDSESAWPVTSECSRFECLYQLVRPS